ncbi:type IX secretion system sortase PorU [Flavobacterium sp.]|uniref:type IX secretion system sortase PorU n=1 Tax=Flavobacterium sp. TaxID=239 RepID=UPI002A8240A1|nr:type IX secretion system sortase PorU [Flavobacterium sp.]
MRKNFIYFMLFLFGVVHSQNESRVSLTWRESTQYLSEDVFFKFPQFNDIYFDLNIPNKTIGFKYSFKSLGIIDNSSLRITNIKFETIQPEYLKNLDISKIPNKIEYSIESVKAKEEFYSLLKLSPIVNENGVLKKVISFQFNYSYDNYARSASVNRIIANSVLSSGTWHRFYVEQSGVYKLSKTFLQSLGVNVSGDPRNIKIYGNGGRMLPLLNSTFYPNDLIENAIKFIGEDDGVFNDSDYILFYAEGIDTWNTESLTSVNLYSDKSYFYVTTSSGIGKRIISAVEPLASPSFTFTNYNDVITYERDLVNAGKVGRRWFGEQFNFNNNQSFDFSIPNLDVSSSIGLKINFASKSFGASSFDVKANNQTVGSVTFPVLVAFSGVEGYENVLNATFNSSLTTVNIDLTYNNGGVPSSNGYLDFIRLTSVRNLNGFGKQFPFFNNQESSNIGVGQYSFINATQISEVWDVTDRFNVLNYVNSSGVSFSFKTNLGSVKKYIAVDLSDIYTPLRESNAVVSNQNLKGTIFLNNSGVFEDIDYLIITPNNLMTSAERLASFHRTNSGLKVKVVSTESIYQEFSSGKQDVAAIRNFIKYVYQNASISTNRVKYVNLFGDASYDYKNRLFSNTNIVPVFHGFNPSASEVNNISNFSLYLSFMSDDFYGLMDDSEGPMIGGMDGIDIAVGRMLVSSVQQANEMVDKVLEYHDEKSFGRWRNNYVIYSDDADNQTDATLQFGLDDLANTLVDQKPFVNVKKIHTDAYIQQVAAGGERYPEAKDDFLDNIELGALVFNYFGHGNEESLGRERLFEKIDAQNLTNKYRYPLFITITCEFTRFDDPNRFTGGEYMYWNKNGGAISLIATTRQIGVTTGFTMNNIFSQELYAFGSNDYPTVSEALRLTKLSTGSDNRRVVFYIGDPALKLAIPKPKVVLTKVNDVDVSLPNDTFSALSLMKVSGEVVDEFDNLISDYNGDLAVQIFDKDINRSTLGNNGTTNSSGTLIIMNFRTLGETIFRGNASVVNGKFDLSFVVPQDIRIPIGTGKISFYSKRSSPVLENQTGHNTDIQIGGVNTSAPGDTTPPTVRLYMNDESFASGGITNCSPYLLAFLEDENGINTASGIGHDIVAILDGDESNPYVLNDYYETENDDYTKGKVRFPFRDLESGMHTILFKAWDVYNNLITQEIQFNAVCNEDGLRIERVLNYPNPFVSYTEFWFSHNMPFELLDVQVQILTITGKLVKTINQQVVTDGFLCREITWDGKDDFGDRIGKGVYVYKLTVRSTTTGKKTEKIEKLVIL